MKVKLTQEEILRQQEGYRLKELCQMEGWIKVLFPILESQIKQAVVDPRSCESDEDYLFKQKTAWAYGQHASDILDMIENKVKEAEFLTEKEQGKHIDKLQEAMS